MEVEKRSEIRIRDRIITKRKMILPIGLPNSPV